MIFLIKFKVESRLGKVDNGLIEPAYLVELPKTLKLLISLKYFFVKIFIKNFKTN